MKLKNIFISLLAATALVACSDDEQSWNNGNATVEMGQSEISVRENAGIFNVPIVVTGEQNDYIRVTVEVAETGSSPAMEDVHYYITSKSIVIPADATSGNIEISAVNDNDINENRTFTITIVDAEGAQIGSQATANVELRDEDSDFYEKLKGSWTLNGVDAQTGGTAAWSVNITSVDEGEAGYGEELFLTGWNGQGALMLNLLYHYDMATNTGSVEILYGTSMGQLNFTGLGVCDVMAGSVNEAGNIYVPTSGSIPGTWNSDLTEVTFDPNAALIGAVVQSGTVMGYYGGLLGDISLSR